MHTSYPIRRLCLIALLGVVGLAVPRLTFAQVRYTITDLGDLGQGISAAQAINNNGQVTGDSLRSGANLVFLWDRSRGIQDLGITNCSPLAINDVGAIVGYGYPNASTTQQGFLYSGGKLTGLMLPGSGGGQANGIDLDGTVVGVSYVLGDGASYSRAFRYDGVNGIQDLGSFGTGNKSQSVAQKINKGRAVGWAETVDSTRSKFVYHAFLHSGSGPLDPQTDDLGTLGGPTSSAAGVNVNGQVAGISATGAKNAQGNDINHAFLYSGGRMYDIGTFPGFEGSLAQAINASGQIIGSVTAGDGSTPFVWTPTVAAGTTGKMELLYNLIPPGSGWTLEYARDINDRGQIVGYGQRNGSRKAFLLTPTLLPDSDGDGIPDEWEQNGYWYNGEHVTLDAADPYRKDIYVYVEWFVGNGHSHKPDAAAMERVRQAFNDSPVSNPVGPDGIKRRDGVNLHVLYGNGIQEPDGLLGTWVGTDYQWAAFDDIKNKNFPAKYRQAYHFCLFAHAINDRGTSGISRGIYGSDFIVALGQHPDSQQLPIGTPTQQAGTFMHELGHNLGLLHGGGDGVNFKPNYLSVMNYFFQGNGLIFKGNGVSTQGKLDYSRWELPALDEHNLDENAGLGGPPEVDNYGTFWFSEYTLRGVVGRKQHPTKSVNRPIDWDWDGLLQGNVAADIHSPDPEHTGLTTLQGFNDWAHLSFVAGAIGLGDVLLPPGTTADEMDLAMASSIRPIAPDGLSTRAGTRSIRLSWQLSAPLAERTYRVYRRTGNGVFGVVATVSSPLFMDASLTSGTQYAYYITAVTTLGAESDPSATVLSIPR